MFRRDHDWADGFHHSGDDYVMVIRQPGAHHINVPKEYHFLDINLGKSSGDYTIVGADKITGQSQPSTFVFLPKKLHREVHTSRSGMSLQLAFSPELLSPLLKPLSYSGTDVSISSIMHMEDMALTGIAQILVNQWTQRSVKAEDGQLDAAAKLMVMRLAYCLTLTRQESWHGNRSAARIQAVLDHVEMNLTDPLPLDELAKIAKLSTYHFARVFRQEIGRSPHQYIVERRVAYAKRQLEQTADPIASIAHDVGFSSQSHMTETFKKVMGVTPGAIRKKAR